VNINPPEVLYLGLRYAYPGLRSAHAHIKAAARRLEASHRRVVVAERRLSRMKAEIGLAAACMKVVHDKEANLKKYLEFIDEAASRSAKLLVFPEGSMQGYLLAVGALGSPETTEQIRYFRAVAEPVPGPTTEVIQQHAEKHDMYIQIGMVERAGDDNTLLNSAVLVGPAGVVGKFSKVHNQFEWPVFKAGSSFPVFDTSIGKVGMFICYDLCFPESVRSLAMQGALIASMSTAWPMKGDDPNDDYYGHVYDVLGEASAIVNQMWVIQANQVASPPRAPQFNYYGHSRIIDPGGATLDDTGYHEGIAIAHVDVKEGVAMARTEGLWGLNLLQDRLPHTYVA
jgi:predicted amidohydrolase